MRKLSPVLKPFDFISYTVGQLLCREDINEMYQIRENSFTTRIHWDVPLKMSTFQHNFIPIRPENRPAECLSSALPSMRSSSRLIQ